MNTEKWLEEVSNIVNSDIKEDEENKVYVSKFDGSYITRVGMEDNVKFLADRGVTDELTHGVGFSPKENKWYGWSHRSIYGFKIGSTCKKGDCHYNGASLKEQEDAAIRFWDDDCHIDTGSNGVVVKDGEKYFDIYWTYDNKIPNKKLRGSISGCKHHIKPLGKGEWTAKSMEDAKQMAIDFSSGVS